MTKSLLTLIITFLLDLNILSGQELRSENVEFQNGNVTLKGILTLPSNDNASFPAIIMVHGSGPSTRKNGKDLTKEWVEKGFAVLRFDKRGSGESTGDWTHSSFKELAEDAIAGINMLQKRKDIKKNKIGIYGHSQGGWIAPLAASLTKDIAFVIMSAPAIVSPKEQVLTANLNYFNSDKFNDSERKEAIAFSELFCETIQTWKNWDKVVDEVEKNKNKTWMQPEYLNLSDSIKRERYWYLHLDFDYNPLTTIKKVNCPILAVFAGRDELVPLTQNKPKYEEVFKKENKKYVIKVIDGANHIFLKADKGGMDEWKSLDQKIMPEYISVINDWLLKFI